MFVAPRTPRRATVRLTPQIAPHETDTLGIESTQNYLKEFGLDLEDASSFIPITILLKIVGTTSIYAITRGGFVEGWMSPQIGSGGKDVKFK